MMGARRLALAAAIALTGCASPAPRMVCPALVPYSRADQAALAAELRAHPGLVQVPRWLGDYVGLRDAVRACGGTQPA